MTGVPDSSDDEGGAAAAPHPPPAVSSSSFSSSSSSSSSSGVDPAWPERPTTGFMQSFADQHAKEVELYVQKKEELLRKHTSDLAKAKEELATLKLQLKSQKQRYEKFEPLFEEFCRLEKRNKRGEFIGNEYQKKRSEVRKQIKSLEPWLGKDEQIVDYGNYWPRIIEELEYGTIHDKQQEVDFLKKRLSNVSINLHNVPRGFYYEKLYEHKTKKEEEEQEKERRQRMKSVTYNPYVAAYKKVTCPLKVGDIIQYNDYNNGRSKSRIIEIKETGKPRNRIKLQSGDDMKWLNDDVFIGLVKDGRVISQKLKDFTLIPGKLLGAKSNQELADEKAKKLFGKEAQQKRNKRLSDIYFSGSHIDDEDDEDMLDVRRRGPRRGTKFPEVIWNDKDFKIKKKPSKLQEESGGAASSSSSSSSSSSKRRIPLDNVSSSPNLQPSGAAAAAAAAPRKPASRRKHPPQSAAGAALDNIPGYFVRKMQDISDSSGSSSSEAATPRKRKPTPEESLEAQKHLEDMWKAAKRMREMNEMYKNLRF